MKSRTSTSTGTKSRSSFRSAFLMMTRRIRSKDSWLCANRRIGPPICGVRRSRDLRARAQAAQLPGEDAAAELT
jgi:hypothetical protein